MTSTHRSSANLPGLRDISPTIVNSAPLSKSYRTPWELRRKRKSRLFDEFTVYEQEKFRKWSHDFRFRRALHGTVQVNMALYFGLLTRICVKLPIEAYRCIRSFLERGLIAKGLDNYPAPARRAVDEHRRYSQPHIFAFMLGHPAWPAVNPRCFSACLAGYALCRSL